MNKREFFLNALRHGSHRYRAWVVSAFSYTKSPSADNVKPRAYSIIQEPGGVFFINEIGDKEKIDDVGVAQVPFRFLESIDLVPGDIPNVKKKITTTYGNVLFNMVALCEPFGDKIEFVTGTVNIKNIETYIASKLESNVKPGETEDPGKIYVRELIKFDDAVIYLTEFNTIAVCSLTKKIITPPPNNAKLKKELLDKHKGQLNDPIVLAEIEKVLKDNDAEYLKGDPGEKFLDKKARDIVRKKLFLIHGAEAGLGDNAQLDVSVNSLTEGWDKTKFPTLNNITRAGSYDRGTDTSKGGEEFKWLLRASSNIQIIKGDCGTTLGFPVKVKSDNLNKITGMYVIENGKPVLVPDLATAKSYIGQEVLVRSPMFCKLPHTDRCSICCGENLSINPDGASMAITNIGSTFMLIRMKSMHGKELKVKPINLETLFS